jgi:hypothetical protein
MLRHEVWLKFIDVSKVLTAFIIIAVMTETASTSETSVNFYHTSWRNIPEDSNFQRGNRVNIFTRINLLSVLHKTSWTLVRISIVAVLYETTFADCPN